MKVLSRWIELMPMMAVASLTLSTEALTWLSHWGGAGWSSRGRRETKVSYPPTITMISRLEIITKSISASTTSMMMVSFSDRPSKSLLLPMLDTSCFSAAVLPKAASIRCTSSTQKWNTYTACARIRPRYSGSCSHRLAKIIDGRGRSGATGMDLGRDMAHTKGVFGGRRDSSVASPIRCRRLRAAIGAQRKAHRAAHTELYWQAMQRRDALRWPAQTDR